MNIENNIYNNNLINTSGNKQSLSFFFSFFSFTKRGRRRRRDLFDILVVNPNTVLHQSMISKTEKKLFNSRFFF